MKKIGSLLFFLLLVFLIEALGHWLTMTSVISWYPTLHKPSWNPPPWVFGPVWTILYITIALAGWWVFLNKHTNQKRNSLIAFIWYGTQLFLNLLWSYCFFFLRNPQLALADIILLLIAILLNIRAFYPIYKPAALLLIPYFLWVLFATLLNTTLVLLNCH